MTDHVITAGLAGITWYATMSPNNSEPRNAVPLRPGDLVDEREAATILGVSRQTLANWRWRNEGPRVRRVGARLVRYHRADLLAFINGEAAA